MAESPAVLICLDPPAEPCLPLFDRAQELLTEAQVSYRIIIAGTALPPEMADYAVVICTAAQGSTLATRIAEETAAPILAVPLSDGSDAPASPAPLLAALETPETAPIGVVAIGEAGATNAALAAISILALRDERLAAWWSEFRLQQTAAVLADRELRLE